VSDPSAVFGRLHPLVLHLPIGMLVALAVLELGALSGRLAIGRRALGLLCSVNALAAVLAASTGWVLGRTGEYDVEVLGLHRNLGIAVAIASVTCALAHAASRAGERRGWLKTYRALLFVSLALLLPAGHFGATLTHGADFLFGPRSRLAPTSEPPPGAVPASEPAEAQPTEPQSTQPSVAPSELTFAAAIQPIFAQRCTNCHGESKRKGKLSLHDAASIEKGGVSGPVVDPQAPQESEMLRRIKLPLEHEDHMPPEGKPQPTADELALLEAWILAGSPFEGPFEPSTAPASAPATKPTAPLEPEAEEQPKQSALGPAPEIAPGAFAALEAQRVHAELVDPEANVLAVEFAALGSDADDALAARLLAPIAENVGELSLARTGAGAQTLALAARMPRLKRLDLRDTPIDDGALAALRGNTIVEDLVLARVHLTDASLETLLSLKALKRVFLWQSGVSAEGLAQLSAQRPGLQVESGDTPDSAALEVEPALALSSDRPLPGSEGKGADALAAKNTVCPVLGSPVSPKYRVIWGGQVIGFCCPECPKAFWADPDGFLAKLR
jgi:uncharacterized membrane protein